MITPKKKQKYLTNANILAAIHDSKMSFCFVLDKKYRDYDLITHDETTVTYELVEQGREVRATRLNNAIIKNVASAKSLTKAKAKQYCEQRSLLIDPSSIKFDEVVIRIMTDEHIPEIETKSGKIEKTRTNFKPFKHFILQEDGEFIEVVRSHWRGDLEDGEFSLSTGKITEELGRIILKFTERLSMKSNFRNYTYIDEMIGAANLQLTRNALLFDESIKTVQLNPFAYYTSIIKNSFRAVLNNEKLQRDIRDEFMVRGGYNPSFTKQVENDMGDN